MQMEFKIANRCSTCRKEFHGVKSEFCSLNCEEMDISCKIFKFKSF